ncbi:3-oxoacyl-[acyl-carrier-protein] synthase III C-terminal domain-containing protein [Maricaulis sp. W15]|uniref:3-oxoacyl-[acyl-carrier-protein] synthase III C-terminal domain-containing protein n=1 Tax=Maricaulis sp. W15 TaxID=1772333 RepID=UPI000948C93B|nr:3-oxoacyl-[acyl-carrier-protein] synthase III C-terminal domain-containing protein [Maricaulis sp. W15]
MTLISQIEPDTARSTRSAPYIAGIAHSLASRRRDSVEIDAEMGRPAGWLERLSGVRSRTVAGPGDSQEAMAGRAALAALKAADISLTGIDLLLFGAAVGRQPIPATAPLIKREIGATHLAFPAYDVNATCLSALTALDIAALQIAAGRARTVLVVTSEIASRALPWQSDPKTAGLFGDGAAAIVLTAAPPTRRQAGGPAGGSVSLRFRDFLMETHAEAYDCCALGAGGTRFDYHDEPEAFAAHALFRMDGPELFRLSATKLPAFIARLLDRLGWSHDDVDLVIPHQASPLALAHMAKRSGFSGDRIFNHVAMTGNLIAASLPVALSSALHDGRIRPGMKLLMVGTSAGVSLGGAGLES